MSGTGDSGRPYCSKCCRDLDIAPLELLFPELYLDTDGQYFLKVHGLSDMSLRELRSISEVLDAGKIKIRHACNQLTDEGLCGIYDARPKLCREYRCETRNIMPQRDRCDVNRKYIPLRVVNG